MIKKLALAAMCLMPSDMYAQVHRISERIYYVDAIQSFCVSDDENLMNIVKEIYLDDEIRDKTFKELEPILEHGYLKIRKIGELYGLSYTVRGLGGGPLAGYVGYIATKALGYGGIAAAGATAIVATGGAAAGVGAAAAGAATTGAAGAAAGYAGLAAGGIAAATGGVETATAVVLAAEAAGGAIAAVETTSLAVGSILTAIPFLP